MLFAARRIKCHSPRPRDLCRPVAMLFTRCLPAPRILPLTPRLTIMPQMPFAMIRFRHIRAAAVARAMMTRAILFAFCEALIIDAYVAMLIFAAMRGAVARKLCTRRRSRPPMHASSPTAVRHAIITGRCRRRLIYRSRQRPYLPDASDRDLIDAHFTPPPRVV